MFSAFKNTGKQGLVYGIGEVASRAVVFLLVPVYTRRLDQSDFGKFGVLNSIAMLLAPILVLGLSSSIFRSLHDHEEDSQHVAIHTALTLLLLWLPGVLAGVLLLSPLVAQFLFGDRNDAGLIFLVVMTASFYGLRNSIPLALYRFRNKVKQYVVFTCLGVLLKVIAILYLVVVRQWGLYGVVWGDCLTAGFLSALLLWTVRTDIGLGFSRSEAKRLLSFGLPLVGASLGSMIFLRSDMFFLTRYAGLHEVAVYNLAVQIGTVLQAIALRPLLLIWLPTILAVSREKFAREYYSRVFVYVFTIVGYLGTVIVVFGNEIVAILGGNVYSDTRQVLPLVILAQILYVSQATLSVGINLKRKTWVVPIVAWMAAMLNLGLNAMLVPRMGQIGAGTALVLSMALFAAGIYFGSVRFYRVCYDWGRVMKVAICLVLAVLLSYMTGYIHAVVFRVLVKLLVLLIPVILLYQWGVLLEDESYVLKSKLSYLFAYIRDKWLPARL